MWTVVLLIVSNVFMTLAWYGHLKFPRWPLWTVVLASWLIAFLEYCFQVPANRLGQEQYRFSVVELKTIQEVITLSMVVIFAMFAFRERIRWNHFVGLAMLVGAAYFLFLNRKW